MQELRTLREECRLMLEQLAEARKEKERQPPPAGGRTSSELDPFYKEVDALVEVALIRIARVVKVVDLDELAAKRDRYDLNLVWEFVEILKKLGAATWSYDFPGRTERGADLLAQIEEQKRTVQERKRRADLGFILHFGLGSDLFGLLFLAVNAGVDLSDAVALLHQHLTDVAPDEVREIWRRIQREVVVQPGEPPRLEVYEDLFPADFFGSGTIDELRTRIAQYSVSLKPQAFLRKVRSGGYSHPIEALSVAALLTQEDPTRISPEDD